MSFKKTFFWNMIAKHYSKQAIANEAAYQKKLDQTQELFTKEMNLFEFGCGTGSTALYHAPKVKSIHATDISSQMISIAKSKQEEANIQNIKFECLSIEDTKLPAKSFDMVLAMSILHLVEDRDAVLQKVHHLLKDGGYFICSTACVADGFPIFKYIAKIGYFFYLLPLVKSFSSVDLIEDLKRNGFTIEEKWQPSKKEALFIIARKTH